MAQFKAFSPLVEVNGQTVLTVVNALPIGQDFRRDLLKKHCIINPVPDKWYNQASWLAAFEELSQSLGSMTLFMIGKAIPENAVFPPEINSLEKALLSIDQAYRMNHRGGEIGYYKLISFDLKERKALMECKNPYPSEFDRGIISSMLRKFKPADSTKFDVSLSAKLPTRLKGANACTFEIVW